MKTAQRTLAILILVISLVMSSCGANETYTLKCDISTENFGFEITGESGSVQTTYNNESQNYVYDASGQVSAITVNVNRDLVYENSKHAYHIQGTITVTKNVLLTYNITATGDTFGNTPQTCKKP